MQIAMDMHSKDCITHSNVIVLNVSGTHTLHVKVPNHSQSEI